MQDEAVTPVVGTVMILGITVLGIGAMLFWGAPTLQAIQDQNSVVAMQGELLEARTATLDLMIDKSSRVPQIVVEGGELGIEAGTRFLITSDQFEASGGAYAGCAMVVTGWTDGGSFDLDQGCTALNTVPELDCDNASSNRVCLLVSRVTGSNFADADLGTASNSGSSWTIGFDDTSDLSTGTWALRLYDDAGDLVAQSWILETDRVSWDLASSNGNRGVHLEAGAVFETDGPVTYLIKQPALQEDASGLDDVFLRLPTYLEGERNSISGSSTIGLFIGQVGNNHVRIQSDATDRIRYAFDGELAESWCNSLLARNTQLSTAAYAEPTPDSCSDDPAVVTYTLASSFPFELSHARITARLQF